MRHRLTEHKSSPRRDRPIVLHAHAFIPFHTHVLGSGDVGGLSSQIPLIYLVGVIATGGLAGFADLRDHAVRLMSGAGDMASADVAMAKAKATLINNLIIVSSHMSGPGTQRGTGVHTSGAPGPKQPCRGSSWLC